MNVDAVVSVCLVVLIYLMITDVPETPDTLEGWKVRQSVEVCKARGTFVDYVRFTGVKCLDGYYETLKDGESHGN